MRSEPIIDLPDIERKRIVMAENGTAEPCTEAAIVSQYTEPATTFFIDGPGAQAACVILLFDRYSRVDWFQHFDIR